MGRGRARRSVVPDFFKHLDVFLLALTRYGYSLVAASDVELCRVTSCLVDFAADGVRIGELEEFRSDSLITKSTGNKQMDQNVFVSFHTPPNDEVVEES